MGKFCYRCGFIAKNYCVILCGYLWTFLCAKHRLFNFREILSNETDYFERNEYLYFYLLDRIKKGQTVSWATISTCIFFHKNALLLSSISSPYSQESTLGHYITKTLKSFVAISNSIAAARHIYIYIHKTWYNRAVFLRIYMVDWTHSPLRILSPAIVSEITVRRICPYASNEDFILIASTTTTTMRRTRNGDEHRARRFANKILSFGPLRSRGRNYERRFTEIPVFISRTRNSRIRVERLSLACLPSNGWRGWFRIDASR